jgi:hypothetical protein
MQMPMSGVRRADAAHGHISEGYCSLGVSTQPSLLTLAPRKPFESLFVLRLYAPCPEPPNHEREAPPLNDLWAPERWSLVEALRVPERQVSGNPYVSQAPREYAQHAQLTYEVDISLTQTRPGGRPRFSCARSTTVKTLKKTSEVWPSTGELAII